MPRFMAQVVTEIEFVGGDASDNYEKHLAEVLRAAAQQLSLRTIQETKVVSVQVGEIKASL